MPSPEIGPNPLISFVIPVHNDEDHIREALDSCLSQTDQDFEIVVVDDFSSDTTPAILDEYAKTHRDRVRVFRQAGNLTAFQARRTGALESRGEYMIFVDGDDTVSPEAVAVLRRRTSTGPDIVHYGCSIVGRDGRRHASFEARLQPVVPKLSGRRILGELFLDQKTFEGRLWDKAYRAAFARPLFKALPANALVPRANDLPVSLMLAANAQSYISTKERLYNYHFGSGGVTDGAITTERFLRLVDFTPSVDVIAGQISGWGLDEETAELVVARVRQQFIGRSVSLLGQVHSPSAAELEALLVKWPVAEILPPLYARFAKRESEFVRLLGPSGTSVGARSASGPVQTVAIYMDQVGMGGMQRVASLQAELLVRAGYKVVVLAAMEREAFPYSLPADSVFVSLKAPEGSDQEGSLRHQLVTLEQAIVEHSVDTVLLHANYRAELMYLVLAAEQLPVRSILTIHSFALRSIFDRSHRFGVLRAVGRRVDCLTVLSRADETFWRLAGVERVHYVPNPVPFDREDLTAEPEVDDAVDASGRVSRDDVPGEPCDVLWVGRINEKIKRVSEVLEIFALVAQARPGTRLHIVGPTPRGAQGDLRRLKELSTSLGLDESVRFLPPVSDVHSLIQTSSVVVNTSIIEGFPYALVEPLVAERPVVMYDLPYLEITKENPGIVTVPWGDRELAAQRVLELLDDDTIRRQRARAGLAIVRTRFSEGAVLDHLESAFATAAGVEAKREPDPRAEIEHARVIIEQLFPLFQESLHGGTSGTIAPEIDAFYRTWYGSRTIRYSVALGGPVIAVRRRVQRVLAAFRRTAGKR